MSLSPKLLAAIQTAGASMSDADAALQVALKDYAAQVATAMGSNPFDVGNDALFEEWKSVARLSQAVTRIEQELRQVFEAISQIAGTKQIAAPATRLISAPAATLVTQVDATDVVAKIKGPLKGNAALVFNALKPLLTKKDFKKINITAVALAAGVAQGSMAATLRRLVRDGYLAEADKGHYKLLKSAK